MAHFPLVLRFSLKRDEPAVHRMPEQPHLNARIELAYFSLVGATLPRVSSPVLLGTHSHQFERLAEDDFGSWVRRLVEVFHVREPLATLPSALDKVCAMFTRETQFEGANFG